MVQRIVTRCIFRILTILLPSLILPAIVIDSTSFPNLPLMYLPSGDATYSDSISSVCNKQLENVQNLFFSFIIYTLSPYFQIKGMTSIILATSLARVNYVKISNINSI